MMEGQLILILPQASLSDRCGALHVGDLLLAVNGVSVGHLDLDRITELIRGDPTIGEAIQAGSAISRHCLN